MAEPHEQRQVLDRVPPQVREKDKQLYEPVVVSYGPYHYGDGHLRRFEDFKPKVVNIILNSDGGAMDKVRVFQNAIMERVTEIRKFYGGQLTTKYDNEALVHMMIRDACLLLYFMEIQMEKKERRNHFNQFIGPLAFTSMLKDAYKLENQIPWWVTTLLIRLTYDDSKAFLREYLSMITLGNNSLKQVPWQEGTDEEPLHLLDASRRVHLMNKNVTHENSTPPSSLFELQKRPFRSATELRAKGISLKKSSVFFDDIKFTSHSFHGDLHLPIQIVDSATTTYFSNIVVFELSAGRSGAQFPVTAYVNFMKSLIEKPKDAKLLQEKGIIISNLEDNESIVRKFSDINTHGIDNFNIFEHIKKSLNDHCNSRWKTWFADLILTKFRTPWSTIGVTVAAFLLLLGLVQTIFTIFPANV